MRREDYEAQESRRGGGGGDGGFSEGFDKAPEEVRQTRRIVRVKRSKQQSPAGGEGEKTGAFANFSFGGTTAAAATPPSGVGGFGFAGRSSHSQSKAGLGVSFGGANGGDDVTTTSPPAVIRDHSVAEFAFSVGAAVSNSKPFSFAPASAAAPAASSSSSFSFGASTKAPSASSASSLAQQYQTLAKKLETDFLTEVQKYPIRNTDISKTLDYYLDAVLCLEQRYWAKAKTASGTGTAGTGNAGKPRKKTISFAAPTDGGTSPKTPPFGGAPPRAATPAASRNSFAATPAASKNSLAMTPGSAGTVSTPAGGAETLLETPPANNNNDPSSSVQEGDADKDWDTLEVLMNTHFYSFSDDGRRTTKVCGGQKLKIQQHKESNSRRMIMRNDASGKVMLNLAVGRGMPVAALPNQKSKKHIDGIEQVSFYGMLDEQKGGQRLLVRRVIDKRAGLEPLAETMEKMFAL